MKISKYDVAVVLSIMFLFASVALPLIHGNSLKFSGTPTYDNPSPSPRKDMAINYTITCNNDSTADLFVVTTNIANGDAAIGSNIRLLLYDPYVGEVARNETNIRGESRLSLTSSGTYRLDITHVSYKTPDYIYFSFSPCPVVLPPLVDTPKTNETIITNVTVSVENNTIVLPPVVKENKTEVVVPVENTNITVNTTGINVTAPKKTDSSSTVPSSNGILDAGLILLVLAGFGFIVLVAAIAYYIYSTKGSSAKGSSGGYSSGKYKAMGEAPKPKRAYKPRKKKESEGIPQING